MALVAIAGQLQLLPAAIACAADHARPAASHCGGPAQPGDGLALTSGHDTPLSPLCALGIGCAASGVALLADATAGVPIADDVAVPARAALAPPSFDSSPAPPPPQA